MENLQEQAVQYFGELAKIHSISATSINKTSFQEKKTNIIYELLQNADDTQATNAIFELYNDKLVFKHNGKRHFSISDPSKEEEDMKNGKIGDINSITSIDNFKQTKSKIGKVGIGFKAVFQYTITPIIYDTYFCFQINQYIIPSLLDKDYLGRKPDETIFVFPFNNPDKIPSVCFSDILGKLNNLQYSTLFLTNITNITFFSLDSKNIIKIEKKTEISLNFSDINAELISITNKNIMKRFWLFSRQLNQIHKISVGFCINNDGFLIPIKGEVHCIFPLKMQSELNFIINAPFLLKENYEIFDLNETHNDTMINELANLASQSIILLKEIGKKYNIRLIKDNILEIIPINLIEIGFRFSNRIPIKPFYYAIQKVFQTEEIIPTIDGYVSKENAYWMPDPSFIELFSEEQFFSFVNNKKAKLVFTSIPMNNNDKKVYDYIKCIVNSIVAENTIFIVESSTKPAFQTVNSNWGSKLKSGWGSSFSSTSYSSYSSAGWSRFPASSSFKGITKEFIEKQSFEWLHKFYKWISKKDENIKRARFAPIFINSNGKAVSAFNSNNNLQLFFPYDSSKEIINPKLIENNDTFIFLKKVGLTVPNLNNEIIKEIIPKYQNESYISTFPDFKKIFFFYKYCSYQEKSNFVNQIKNASFILYFTKENSKIDRAKACDLYFPSDFLFAYFEHLPQKKYIAFDQYIELIDKKDEKLLITFFKELGVSENVKIIKFEINNELVKKYNLPQPYYTQYIRWNEFRIEEFDYIWNLIQKDQKKAIVLWNVLINLTKSKDSENLSFGVCSYFYYTDHNVKFPSIFRTVLINTKWLTTVKNELVAPSEAFLKELPKQFHVNDDEMEPICKFLDVKKRDVDLLTQEFINDHDFVQRLISAGLFQKVKKELEEKELKLKQTKK